MSSTTWIRPTEAAAAGEGESCSTGSRFENDQRFTGFDPDRDIGPRPSWMRPHSFDTGNEPIDRRKLVVMTTLTCVERAYSTRNRAAHRTAHVGPRVIT